MTSQPLRSQPLLLLLLLLSLSLLRDPTYSEVQARDVTLPNGRRYIRSTSPQLPDYQVLPLPADLSAPRNIHLAYGRNELQITVTWNTKADNASSWVLFRLLANDSSSASGSWQLAKGWSTKFVDGGSLRATQFVHRAVLEGLQPGKIYQYCVGADDVAAGGGNLGAAKCAPESPLLDFRLPSGVSRSFAIYGDLGLDNAQSLPRLLHDVTQLRLYDAILHVGDFAYDMPDNNGTVGDQFMQLIQPIAGRLPYMTCVGNHEEKYNFLHYKARFSMPPGSNNSDKNQRSGGSGIMFYSVDIGPVHLTSISNEFYFFLNYGSEPLVQQYRWLEADLRRANANRARVPWLILVGHRPMYCSNNSTKDCAYGASTLRDGFVGSGRWALEPLMMKYGVDLAFWGHEHSYERTLPVCNGRVVSKSYVNPRAPVHVITGSAGNKEKHAYFNATPPAYSAFRSTDYGYTRVRFENSSHAYLEQVSDDKAGRVIDSFVLVQTKHGPFL